MKAIARETREEAVRGPGKAGAGPSGEGQRVSYPTADTWRIRRAEAGQPFVRTY